MPTAEVLPRGVRLIALALACASLGCETTLVDPMVDYGDEPPYVPEGDPHLEIGYYTEQLYAPLEDGDTCFVIHGLQGGTWTMPALRTAGVLADLRVQCSLTTAAGELLGATDEPQRFYLAPDRMLEVQAFPIPVTHAPPREADPIDDLFGQEATLDCRVTDDEGREAAASARCVLEGH